MNSLFRWIIVVLVVAGILSFMLTYTVRFTEVAVITTFGKAGENSVKREPGMGLRWPYPIQSVVKYDTRLRLVETRAETVATADNKQVIITVFMQWRVSDPLKFFGLYGNAGARAIDHFRVADEALRKQLRAATAQTSRFKLTELLSTDSSASKLPELEASILATLTKDLGGKALADSGIDAVAVGLSSFRLPEATTKEVFDRMKSRRTSIAAEAASRGNATAESIRSQARNDASIIESFARRRAAQIRGQGDQEASQFYALMKDDVGLATFLKNLEFMRTVYSKRTTLILPLSDAGWGLFKPSTASQLGEGVIPSSTAPAPAKPASKPGASAASADASVATIDTRVDTSKEPR